MAAVQYKLTRRMIEGVGPLRLNLGCGEYPLQGFINVDAVGSLGVDVVLTVPPLPWPDECISEIWMCHFLEHLDRPAATHLLSECHRVMEPDATLGVVVPDFWEMTRRYINNEAAPFEWPAGQFHDLRDLDALNHFLLYSTCQPSHHQWMYDRHTLAFALRQAGFEVGDDIDRYKDPRLGTGQWYQFGLEARKVR